MQHVHRYKLSGWVFCLLTGIAAVAFAIGTLAVTYPDIIAGRVGLLGFLMLPFLLLGVLPFGLFMLITPFITKVIVSPQGLEYYVQGGVIEADWHSFQEAHVAYVESVKTLRLVPTKMNVRLNWFGKLVPWYDEGKLIKSFTDGIPISWFGGQRLESDIQEFAPRLNF